MATTLVERPLVSMSMSSYTCTHSSRVGTTMSALTPCAGSSPEALDDGDAEAEGLAGAGLGLADDVLAREGRGGWSAPGWGTRRRCPLGEVSTMSWSTPSSAKVVTM
jgi:hypothetical protein